MALPSPHLSEIPAEGLSVECEVQPDELTLGPDEARVKGALALSVEIAQADGGAHVTGVLRGTFVRQCVRCLTDYEDSVELPFTAEYRCETPPARQQPQPSRASGRAQTGSRDAVEPDEPEIEADDVYALVGDRLDLAEMLREQIILATPMQSLCRENCLGLCPVCGQDRNERQCGCSEEPQDSPFAVLKKLQGGQTARPR